MTSRLVLATVGMLAAAFSSGCGLGYKCGVFPGPSPSVNDAGMVTFAPLVVGKSETLSIPIQDSVSAGDTITGAQLTGDNPAAFHVLSAFPMVVPGSGGASIVIQFAPTEVGTASANMLLPTFQMGTATVPLTGVGISAE